MYLDKLTDTYLGQLLKQYEKFYANHKEMEQQDNTALEDQKKSGKLLAILTDPNYASNLRTFPENWKLIERYGARSGQSALHARLLRHQYFTSYLLAWQWLVRFVNHALKMHEEFEDDDQHAEPTAWYVKVIGRIKYQKKITAPYTISPAEVGCPIEGVSPITVASTAPRYAYSDEIQEDTFDQAFHIFSHWLGFPTDPDFYYKAYFLHLVSVYISPHALYLEITDLAFCHFKSRVVGIRRLKRSLCASDFGDFLVHLKLHPSTLKASPIKAALDQIGAIFEKCYQSFAIPPTWLPVRLRLFTRFITITAQLIPHQGAVVANLGRIPHTISLNPDFYLPFREIAPSLSKALSANPGPYASTHLKTRAGFFSALIFRALTFAAPIAKEDGIFFFQDLEHWNGVYDEALQSGLNDDYVRKINAYGQPNFHRQPSIVPQLWESSEVWEDMLKKLRKDDDGKIDPVDFFQFMVGKKGVKFANISSLTAYLLTADYVAAGLVGPPSFDAMAGLIVDISKGALQGLRDLGLLPQSRTHKVGKPDVELALQKLWAYLEEHLEEEVKTQFNFNLVFLEHALCKFTRLNINVATDL